MEREFNIIYNNSILASLRFTYTEISAGQALVQINEPNESATDSIPPMPIPKVLIPIPFSHGTMKSMEEVEIFDKKIFDQASKEFSEIKFDPKKLTYTYSQLNSPQRYQVMEQGKLIGIADIKMESWDKERLVEYRSIYHIKHDFQKNVPGLRSNFEHLQHLFDSLTE